MNPPLKWHGGKHYLAARIVELMPAHIHYVEPYAGGLSVLLAKDPEETSEVVGDVNQSLMNFWKVLQRQSLFYSFQRIIEAAPFAEFEWSQAAYLDEPDDMVESAVAFFICCRQSLAGRMKSFAPLSKTRTRRGMNEQVSAWLNAIAGLPEVHARLKRVVILEGTALKLIGSEDGPDTLFYCDPPYLQGTRTARKVYRHEMSTEDHETLLRTLRQVKGKVMLSGYPSELYSSMLSGWTCHTFDLPNHAAGGEQKARMTECVWCNW